MLIYFRVTSKDVFAGINNFPLLVSSCWVSFRLHHICAFRLCALMVFMNLIWDRPTYRSACWSSSLYQLPGSLCLWGAWFWEDCHTQTLAHHFHWTVLNLHTHTVSYCSPGLPSSGSCVRFHFCLPSFSFFSRIMVRSPLVKWSSCRLLLWCAGQPPLVDVAVTAPFQVGYSWQLIGQTWVGSKLIATALIWINLIAIVRFC